jgi:putative iron-regulated protein
MRVALVNHDQEDEHSCFSDNTHSDIIANIQGMINIYEGRYHNFQGKGLADLLNLLDKDLAEKMQENLTYSLQCAKAIQPPFDIEISAKNPQGNERILKTIQALDEQTTTIEEIAKLLGVSINTKGT